MLVMGVIDGQMSLRPALIFGGRIRGRATWQGDDDARTLSLRTPDHDLSMMKLHKLAYDRESKSAAAVFAGSGSVGTVKGLEDV